MIDPLHFYMVAIIWALAEIAISKKNESRLLAIGAKEYGKETYPPLAVLYIATLVFAPAESMMKSGSLWLFVATIFFISKFLKVWVIHTLCGYWVMKIYHWEGQEVCQGGPYKYFKHPNYVIMMIEIPAYCLAGGAWITFIVSTPVYICFLWRKIKIENSLLYGGSKYLYGPLRRTRNSGKSVWQG